MHTRIAPEMGSSLRPDERLQEMPQGTYVSADEVALQAYQQGINPIIETPPEQREVSELPAAEVTEEALTAAKEADQFFSCMTRAIRNEETRWGHGGNNRQAHLTWRDERTQTWAFLSMQGGVREPEPGEEGRKIHLKKGELMLVEQGENYVTVFSSIRDGDHLEIRDEVPSCGNFPGEKWEITDETERQGHIDRVVAMLSALYEGDAIVEPQMSREIMYERGNLHPLFILPSHAALEEQRLRREQQ